jgi:hypothetical protein
MYAFPRVLHYSRLLAEPPIFADFDDGNRTTAIVSSGNMRAGAIYRHMTGRNSAALHDIEELKPMS